ncbi:hypothetical protein FM038_006875 [Shewanella eurypsychrophilus]|uniref:Lipoprotein n=1 Tax=Shewanella eurypsychrophilus TaxID=2593656 RepID=A0ABX6V3I0_9GAMM|nr:MULTISPECIES: hypothetical protein [Shewanella]QFU21903.1 hypothetical protein FS418_08455 [Shewanella sp. YLB-09]QPG57192.1 hypothetical protein FM038_006875 [Shewanella eurypsychrophilus]
MRFIGSHQIIKNFERVNSPEPSNQTGLLCEEKSKGIHQEIQALLLLFSGMIMFLIAGCTDEKDVTIHEAEIAKVREVQSSEKITTFDQYWQLTDNGIHWLVDSPNQDQLEMSGLQVSAVIEYGLGADGNLVLEKP